jgi:hypothetical protein
MSSDAHDECRDIEDIKRLKSRYFRYLDAKDWNGFRGLFTDDATFDGVWDYPDGPDKFVDSAATGLATMTTVHYGFMPDIELTGPDTARGVWSLHDYLEWPEPIESYRGIAVPGMRAIRGYGYYEETYRRVGSQPRWAISSLRLVRLRVDPVVGPALPRLESHWPTATNQ